MHLFCAYLPPTPYTPPQNDKTVDNVNRAAFYQSYAAQFAIRTSEEKSFGRDFRNDKFSCRTTLFSCRTNLLPLLAWHTSEFQHKPRVHRYFLFWKVMADLDQLISTDHALYQLLLFPNTRSDIKEVYYNASKMQKLLTMKNINIFTGIVIALKDNVDNFHFFWHHNTSAGCGCIRNSQDLCHGPLTCHTFCTIDFLLQFPLLQPLSTTPHVEGHWWDYR